MNARVGRRMSARRREALAEVLADMEAEHGPVDEAEVEAILARRTS